MMSNQDMIGKSAVNDTHTKRMKALVEAIAAIRKLDRSYCGSSVENPDEFQKFKRLYYEFVGLLSRIPHETPINDRAIMLEMLSEDQLEFMKTGGLISNG